MTSHLANTDARDELSSRILELLLRGRMAPSEVAKSLKPEGFAKTTVLNALKALSEAGAISFEPTYTQQTKPGQPKGHYFLDAGQRRQAEEEEAARPADGAVHPGMTLVTAQFEGAQIPDLMDVLGTVDLIAGASWIGRLDGEANAYMFAFGPDEGSLSSDRLTAALAEVGLRTSIAVIREVSSAHELLAYARAVRSPPPGGQLVPLPGMSGAPASAARSRGA